MNTRALLLDRALTLSVGNRELACPIEGEALIRVEFAGVCESDLKLLRCGARISAWPATLGHEVSGIVELCPGGELPRGTPVVADSRIACGSCAECVQSPAQCDALAWLGEARPGGFARHLVLPVRSLVSHPPELDPAVAVLAEPLAVAMHAVSQAAVALSDLFGAASGLRDTDRALVIGYDTIGALTHAELVRQFPEIKVSVRETLAERRLLAAAFGAHLDDGPLVGGYPLVLDTGCSARSLRAAIQATARGGLVVVALGHDGVQFVPADLARASLALVGCNGFADELPEAVSVLAADPDRYVPLVTETVLLDEAPQQMSALRHHPPGGKVLLRP
jgi:threonine dehydrogenase-like Zn-dependent dehydrogenase